jgi:hypothetical protein
MEKWEKTAPQVIVEFALIDLCQQVPDLAEGLEKASGPATKKTARRYGRVQGPAIEDR